jgi:hypothetical protein
LLSPSGVPCARGGVGFPAGDAELWRAAGAALALIVRAVGRRASCERTEERNVVDGGEAISPRPRRLRWRPPASSPRAPSAQRSERLRGEQPFSGKVYKERLRILQVGSIEAFGEPAVDRREQVMGFPPVAPIGPKPGEIAGGSKLEDA